MAPQQSLRVLAYSDSLYFSGAEAIFCGVVEALARRSWCAVSCAAPRENHVLVEEITRACGSAPVPVPGQCGSAAAFFLYDPLRQSRIRRVLEEHRWDVLLVNLPSAEYGSTPLLLDLGGCGKTVGLMHIHHRLGEVGFRLGAMREWLSRRAIRRLDGLCVVSPWARDLAESFWVDPAVTQVHVIRTPRPRVGRLPKEVARARLGLPLTQRVVGIAGRISFRQKGHDTFLEAADLLVRRGVEVRFAVAGEGRDRQILEDAIGSRGLVSSFHLLGSVRPIDAFLSAVDVLAIPSRFEGVPLIALEALQAGTPAVATAIDGLRQFWPTEWQVAPDDARGLADALQRLIASPSASMGAMVGAAERAESLVTDDPGADFERALASVVHSVADRWRAAGSAS